MFYRGKTPNRRSDPRRVGTERCQRRAHVLLDLALLEAKRSRLTIRWRCRMEHGAHVSALSRHPVCECHPRTKNTSSISCGM
jgi:hypothetical protein